MPEHKVALREKKSPHILERHPRYDVLVNGEVKGELYYNMTGYVGVLPTVSGASMQIGEKGITAFRKEVSRINREARRTIEVGLADYRKIVDTRPTSDNRYVLGIGHVNGSLSSVHLISRRELTHAKAFLGEDPGLAFFRDPHFSDDASENPTVLLRAGDEDIRAHLPDNITVRVMSGIEAENHERYIEHAFKTSDPETFLVVGTRVIDHIDPEPVYVTRQSLAFGNMMFGEGLRIGDLTEAEPVTVTDPEGRSWLRANITWFDPDVVPDAAEVHEHEQEALSRAWEMEREQGEPLDAAQRHEAEQDFYNFPGR